MKTTFRNTLQGLSLVFALVVLPVAARAAVSSMNYHFDGKVTTALDAVRAYRPYRLANGCNVEAVVFADWFMKNEIAGPTSWARDFSITAQTPDGHTFGHSVTLFQINKDTYLWDMTFGLVPAKLDVAGFAKKKPGITMGQIAETVYNERYRWMVAKAQAGQLTAEIPSLTTDKPLQNVVERINDTRPTFHVTIKQAGTGVATEMVGFIVKDSIQTRLFLYDPVHGTLVGAVEANADSTMKRIVESVYGSGAVYKLHDVKAPQSA